MFAPITAGRDSRCLVGCSREGRDDIVFFTADYPRPDRDAAVDIDLAKRLAARFRLKHKVLAHVSPTQKDLERALYETGCSVGERRGWRNVPTMRQLHGPGTLLTGHAAEVGKCYYWREDDETHRPLSPTEVVQRLHLPTHPTLLAGAERWLEQCEVRDRLQVLDILYLEQRLGCWVGVSSYRAAVTGPFIYPFSHRRVFELLIGLDAKHKCSGAVFDEVLKQAWPELLEFPFNEPVSARLRAKTAFDAYAHRASRRFKRAASKVGRMLAVGS